VQKLNRIVSKSASVDFHLEPLQEWLKDEAITEIAVNRPEEVFIQKNSQWKLYSCEKLDYAHCLSLATAIAAYQGSDFNDTNPILSAVLPDGERIQVICAPACEPDTISFTIRKPSFTTRTLSDYQAQGFFSKVKPIKNGITDIEEQLIELKETGRYMDFLKQAIRLKKVIVVAGETGSGKTTFMKALMQEISKEERIITIEDVPELFLPNHPNHVHLFYPSEASEENHSPVTSATLLKSCLRMNPSRILLAELRGAEAFDFINVCASGHGGSITSCHAGSAALTFERLMLMTLQNRQGRTLPPEVIERLLYLTIDIVIHVTNDIDPNSSDFGRYITEIWYEPSTKFKQKLS